MTLLIVIGLRKPFTKLKSKKYITIDNDSTTTAVSDMCKHIFKEKASTQQYITLKLMSFVSIKMEKPEQMRVLDQGTWKR